MNLVPIDDAKIYQNLKSSKDAKSMNTPWTFRPI